MGDLICSMLSMPELFRPGLVCVLLKVTCEIHSHLKALSVYRTGDIFPSKHIGVNIIIKSCFLKHSLVVSQVARFLHAGQSSSVKL